MKKKKATSMRLLWQCLAMVLCGSWASVSMARCETPDGGVDDLTLVPPLYVSASAAPRTLIWRSPDKVTRYTCTDRGPGQVVLAIQDLSASLDPRQVDAQIVWSRVAVPGPAARGVQSGVANATTTLMRPSQIPIGNYGDNGYAMDLTWRIELYKSAATTANGLSRLGRSFFFLTVGRPPMPDGYLLGLSGLQIRIRPASCVATADNVNMPAVFTNELSNAGLTAGEKRFSIQLRNCTDEDRGGITNGRNVRIYFDGPAVDRDTRRLKVDRANANVQIELLNGNSRSVIRVGEQIGFQNVDTAQINAGSVDLPFIARYYATGAATAGAANSRVSFTVEYP